MHTCKQVIEYSLINDLILDCLHKSGYLREIIYMKMIFDNTETYEPYIIKMNKLRLVHQTQLFVNQCSNQIANEERINLMFDNFVNNKKTFALLCKEHLIFQQTVYEKLKEYLEYPSYQQRAWYYLEQLGPIINPCTMLRS